MNYDKVETLVNALLDAANLAGNRDAIQVSICGNEADAVALMVEREGEKLKNCEAARNLAAAYLAPIMPTSSYCEYYGSPVLLTPWRLAEVFGRLAMPSTMTYTDGVNRISVTVDRFDEGDEVARVYIDGYVGSEALRMPELELDVTRN